MTSSLQVIVVELQAEPYGITMFAWSKESDRTGKRAQQLRTLVVLPEDCL